MPRPQGDPVAPTGVAHADWAQVDQMRDAAETVAALAGSTFDWVVVDHYSFDARWHRAIREATGARVLVVDDLADRMLLADLVVDHNHAIDHARKYARVNLSAAPVLGGPAHALLDPRYATAPRYAFHPEVRSIGVFMGGADEGNYAAMAWRALREHLAFTGPVEIVSTSANPHLDSLHELAARDPAVDISLDLPDLCAFFARHDLQVGAGGGATWERCCLGSPTVAIVVAENQRQVLTPLTDRRVLRIGPHTPPTAADIAAEVRRLIDSPAEREDLSRRGRELVDGLGTVRVLHHLRQP